MRLCEYARRFSLPIKTTGGLNITPDPDLQELEKDNRPAGQDHGPIYRGDQVATVGDVYRAKRAEAQKRMGRMETVINDQLVECDYNQECRKTVYDSAKLGTGIIKGPSVRKKIDRRFAMQEGAFKLTSIESNVPYTVRSDPWYIFPTPDAGDTPRNATGIWEYSTISPRKLASLIGVNGYDVAAIKKILLQQPIRTEARHRPKQKQVTVNRKEADFGNHYEMWEYNGALSRDSLAALGCDFSHANVDLALMSCCIVYVNDIPIKVILNTLDSGEHPYDFFPWTEVTGSPWGIGIPRQMFYLQKIMTAAWRAMMDNAGDSAGVNIVIGKNLVPEDGQYTFGRRKLWRFKGGNVGEEDVRKAFAQFQVNPNQAAYENIIDMVLRFADLETGIPAIFQGEAQKVPETLGATNIIVNSANIGLRRRAILFDELTDAHITRYYHYNMQYHPDESIKGDYQVDAIASRVLLERDQQTQDIVQLFQLKADPDVRRRVDWDKAIKMFNKNRRLDLLKSDEDVKKAKQEEQDAQAPPDPRIAAAKIRQETELEKKKMDIEDNRAHEGHQERHRAYQAGHCHPPGTRRDRGRNRENQSQAHRSKRQDKSTTRTFKRGTGTRSCRATDRTARTGARRSRIRGITHVFQKKNNQHQRHFGTVYRATGIRRVFGYMAIP